MHPPNQPGPPYGQYPYGYQGQPPYPPQRPPQPYVSVSRERGLGGLTHTANLLLTIFTCGVWGIVWATWWIVRMIFPKKTRTRHYYQ